MYEDSWLEKGDDRDKWRKVVQKMIKAVARQFQCEPQEMGQSNSIEWP